MYSRFFSFGCSYTKYIWPTWADIIADDLRIDHYNYARPGLGNVGIQSEIIKADLEKKFKQDDLIIIMWSHWNREDRFISGKWQSHGNIFNNHYYDQTFIDKYWSFDNDIIKNATAIISINKAYNGLIKFQSNIISPGDFESKEKYQAKNTNELFRFYHPVLPNRTFTCKDRYMFDGHPSIKSYLDYIESSIYPCLQLYLKKNTLIKYQNLDKIIKKIDKDKKIHNKKDLIVKAIEKVKENESN